MKEKEPLPRVDLDTACKTAEDFVLKHQNRSNLSTFAIVDQTGSIHQIVSDCCHARITSPLEHCLGEPLVHAEKFCGWKNQGEAGQRFYKWICKNQDSKKSLFSKWSDGGIRLVKNDEDQIVGALWTNMLAPQVIVSQWMLGARCPGEYNRAFVWDTVVQAGLSPIFAFWLMHMYSIKNNLFDRSITGHVGITKENTLRRLLSRDPKLEDSRNGFLGYVVKVKPFRDKSPQIMFSNHIWEDEKEHNFCGLFPKVKRKSGFGEINTSVLNLESIKDGAKRIEDKLEIKI